MFRFSRFHSHTYNQRRGVTLSLKVRWVLGRRGEHIRPDKTAFPISFIAHESRAQWRYGTGIVVFLHDYNQTISHSTGFHHCNISSADLNTHRYGVCIFIFCNVMLKYSLLSQFNVLVQTTASRLISLKSVNTVVLSEHFCLLATCLSDQ